MCHKKKIKKLECEDNFSLSISPEKNISSQILGSNDTIEEKNSTTETVKLNRGKLTFCDTTSAYFLNKEEKDKNCKNKAIEAQNILNNVNDFSIAKQKVNQIIENFKCKWHTLFRDFNDGIKHDKKCIIKANQILPQKIYAYMDIDAFYASVETLVKPCDKPMAVGSLSMLAACNYAARDFGIKSGMPGYQAKALCPHLEIRPLNFALYNFFSDKIMKILSFFDEKTIVFGLDECCLIFDKKKMKKAFYTFCKIENGKYCIFCKKEKKIEKEKNANLENYDFKYSKNKKYSGFKPVDIYENSNEIFFFKSRSHKLCLEKIKNLSFSFKNIELLLLNIRKYIQKKTNLTMSGGISVSIGLSKLVTSVNKPNGQFTLNNKMQDYLKSLNVDKLNGIGKRTKIFLNENQIFTVQDLQENLYKLFIIMKTKSFYNILKLSFGLSRFDKENCNEILENKSKNIGDVKIEYENIQNKSKMFSISRSKTFLPTTDKKIILFHLWHLSSSVSYILEDYQASLISLKVKSSAFKSVQKQKNKVVRSDIEIFNSCTDLLKDIEVSEIRLLRVRIGNFAKKCDFKRQKIELFQCFVCGRILRDVAFKFFNLHVNSCLDHLERKQNQIENVGLLKNGLFKRILTNEKINVIDKKNQIKRTNFVRKNSQKQKNGLLRYFHKKE